MSQTRWIVVASFVSFTVAALAAIDSVSSSQAVIGTKLDVTGSGFTLKPKAYLENQTTHKRYPLKVTLPTDSTLSATVTKGVLGLHDLVVVPKGKGLEPLRFSSVELVGPTITNVIPGKAEPNQTVTLACPNCGTKRGKVLIAGKPMKVVLWDGVEGRVDFKLSKTIAVGPTQVVVQNTLGTSDPAALEVVPLGSSKGAFDATFRDAHWTTVPLASTDDLWFTTNGGGGGPTGFHLFATHVGKEPTIQFAYTFIVDFSFPSGTTFPATATAPAGGPQSTGVATVFYERDRTTKPIAFVDGANCPRPGFSVTVQSFDGETLVGSFTGPIYDLNGTYADQTASGTFTAHLRTP
jgi:hypothetical protein